MKKHYDTCNHLYDTCNMSGITEKNRQFQAFEAYSDGVAPKVSLKHFEK